MKRATNISACLLGVVCSCSTIQTIETITIPTDGCSVFPLTSLAPGASYVLCASAITAIYVDSYYRNNAGSLTLEILAPEPTTLFQLFASAIVCGDESLGGVSKSFSTDAGAIYSLSFDLSGKPDPNSLYADENPIETLQVNVAGSQSTFLFDTDTIGNSYSDMRWRKESLLFSATGPLSTLSLVNVMAEPVSAGPAIDNVSVFFVRGASEDNGDGTVDAADYVMWRRSSAAPSTFNQADGNLNDTVDQADFDLWRMHFGEVIPAASDPTVSADSVPERVSPIFVCLAVPLAVAAHTPRRGRVFR